MQEMKTKPEIARDNTAGPYSAVLRGELLLVVRGLAVIFLLLSGPGCRRSSLPSSRIERLALARASVKSGDVARALELYRSLISDERADRSRIALEAALFCRSRRMPDGVLYYTDFVAPDAPERRTADELLVEALLDKKESARLKVFLESRWKTPATRVWAGPYLAEMKDEGGDLAGALAICDTLIQEAPDREEEWRLAKARLLLGGRAPDKAAAEFRALLAKNPKAVPGHLGLAALAVENKDWQAAEQHFRKALESSPESADALLGLGFTALARRKLSEAGAYYARALALPNPPYRKLYPYLDLLYRRRDPGQLEKIAAVRPQAGVAAAETGFRQAAAGLASLLNGEPGAALSQLSAAVKADPEHVDPRVVLVRLARLELEAGHTSRARALMEKARKRGPVGREGALVLAELSLREGDYPAAVRLARDAGVDDPRAAWILAQCDAAMARLEEARRYLHPFQRRKSIPREPFAAADTFLEADALEAGGAAQAAAKLLENLAQGKGDAPARVLARAKLAWVRGEKKKAAALLLDLEKLATTGEAKNAVRLLRLRLALVIGDRKAAADLLAALEAGKVERLDLYQAWLAVLNRDWELARKRLANCRSRFGWDAVARHTLQGTCALKRGEFTAAAEAFDQATRAVAKPAPVLLALARDLYARAGKLDLAVDRARACVKATPDDPGAWMELGRLQRLNRRTAEYLATAERARNRFPKNAQVAAALCTALLEAGRYADSVSQARKLLREFPGNSEIRLVLSEALLALRKTDALEKVLAEFPPDDPASAQAALLRVMDRAMAGNYAAALALLNALPNRSKSTYRARLLRAFLLYRTGHAAEAEKICGELTKQVPDAADAFLLLGELCARRGRADLAVDAFRKCVALNENSVAALNNLAWLLVREHKALPEAASCIQRARRLAPDSAAVRDTQAAMALVAGNWREALDAALAAGAARPGFWPWFHAAAAAAKLADPKAPEYLAKARALAKSPEETKLIADLSGKGP